MKITGHRTVSGETFGFDFGNDGLVVRREFAEMHPVTTLDHSQRDSHWALIGVLVDKRMYGPKL